MSAPVPEPVGNRARRKGGGLAPGLEGLLCLRLGPRKEGCDWSAAVARRRGVMEIKKALRQIYIETSYFHRCRCFYSFS